MQEDGGWHTNVDETCKADYIRVSMLTKLSSIENLLHVYKQFIRSRLEYCIVAMHSSLTLQQLNTLEQCQAISVRLILQKSYISYDAALEMSRLTPLSTRRRQ